MKGYYRALTGVMLMLLLTLGSSFVQLVSPMPQQAHSTNTPRAGGLWYSGKTSDLRVPPPENFSKTRLQSTATIEINYLTGVHNPPFDEYCLPWPDEAKAAFAYAASIWESQIVSQVPIKIDTCWGNIQPEGVLGYSSSYNSFSNFTGAPRSNTWYPVSLANALHGADLDPGQADMYIAYNSTWGDNGDWYYGTDGETPASKLDFASVVLHEIAHGLGFNGSMYVSGNTGSWGGGSSYPRIFDIFAQNGSGQSLIDTDIFPNPSTALGQQLTSDNIYFTGLNAVSANGGSAAKLYVPSSWQPGSSFYHLDESFNGTPNALMTWSVDSGESMHSPGDVTMGIVQDIGWSVPTNDVPDTVNPALAVTPSSGAAGTLFTYTGTDFSPGESVTNWLIRPDGSRQNGTAKVADNDGQFTGSWTIGTNMAAGTYTMHALGAKSNQEVSASFTVTEATPPPANPSLSITPSSGPYETKFTYTGTDFTAGEAVTTWLVDKNGKRYDGEAKTANTQGTFTGSWTLYEGSAVGTYTAYASGAQSNQTASVSFTITGAAPEETEPTLKVSPVSGAIGSKFTYTGEDFVANESVSVWLIDSNGTRYDSTNTANNWGELSGSWLIEEDDLIGTYTAHARGAQSQKEVQTSFNVTAAADTSERVSYAGTFVNTTVDSSGKVTLDIVVGNDTVSGYMNFSNHFGDLPICGAGEFVGKREGNNLMWQFASNDPDVSCLLDSGDLIAVDSTISEDESVIAGTYTRTSNNETLQGKFQVRLAASESSVDPESSVAVEVQTNSNGMATATLHSGTIADRASVVGRTGDVLDVVEVEFTGDSDASESGTVYLPLVLRNTQAVVLGHAATSAKTALTKQPYFPTAAPNDDTSDNAAHPTSLGQEHEPAHIILQSADTAIPADGQSQTTITIQVVDSNNTPLANEIIMLDTTLGSLSTEFTLGSGQNPPTSVSIDGPATGDVGTFVTFTASAILGNTSDTVNYVWSPEPIIGQGKSQATYRWLTAGEKTITVEAVNTAGSARASTTITLDDTSLVAPSLVTLDGPTEGDVDTPYAFTVQVSPEDTTLPVKYTWQTDDDELTRRSRQLHDSVSITWDTPGLKSVQVTVQNAAGEKASIAHQITIHEPVVELLEGENFDFEQGPDVGWTSGSFWGLDVIVDELPDDTSPHSGNWVAWLGGYDYEVTDLYQFITIPEHVGQHTRLMLSFYYWASSEEACGMFNDTAEVSINTETVYSEDLCQDNNTDGWQKASYDVSDYAGQMLLLFFQVITNWEGNSNFLVDDVAFEWEGGEAGTPVPTATPLVLHTPTPVSTPTPIIPPIFNTATPIIPPVFNTATPIIPPVFNTPTPIFPIFNTPTPMPQPPNATPTPTPPAQTLPDLFNGDFEQGPDVGWSEVSDQNKPMVMNDDVFESITARSGTWLAVFGGIHDENSTLSQQVTLPPDDANATLYLQFYYQRASEETCLTTGDGFMFYINDELIDQSLLCEGNNDGTWQLAHYDMSAYAGQTIEIQFGIVTDGTLLSLILLDDVAFAWEDDAGGETATPTPTLQPDATMTPTPTPQPDATATPTPTPQPDATSTPTPTPQPDATSTPTPTPTPQPDATSTPTPTPTPTTAATSTPTPTPTPTTAATSTPTPTPTPTTAATSTPTPELSPLEVSNGDFELGPGVGWMESSSSDAKLVRKAADAGISAYSGTWLAWLGALDNETSELSQPVSLPDTTANVYLEFYYQHYSEESCDTTGDYFKLLINDVVIDDVGLCQDFNSVSWQVVQYDISAYKGQIVDITFKVVTDDDLQSNFFIDDVSIYVSNMTSQDISTVRKSVTSVVLPLMTKEKDE